jgi:hypothetical protein
MTPISILVINMFKGYFWNSNIICRVGGFTTNSKPIVKIFHSIRSFLYFKQTGEIDNLIVSWEQSIWLCCVQVPHCSWQSKAWTRRLINYPELSQASKHHLQSYWLLPLLIDIPWFLTEGKPCYYIHHIFLLGFPTGR